MSADNRSTSGGGFCLLDRHGPIVGRPSARVVAGLKAGGTELVRYENSYWLCYVRGPEGIIIIELAEKIG